MLGAGASPAVLRSHPVEHVDVLRVEHHPDLGQREAEQLLEIADPGDPGHVGLRVEALTPSPVAARPDETELLPVAQRAGGEAGQLGHLADAEAPGRGVARRCGGRITPASWAMAAGLRSSSSATDCRFSSTSATVLRVGEPVDRLGPGASSLGRLGVDVAPAPQPRRPGGGQAGHDGEVEGGVEAGLEGAADETGEEAAAGEDVLLGGREQAQGWAPMRCSTGL